ncbi:MAG: hypothetical protein ACXW5U_18235 [Thermoanaerobaculia bacterium]
MSLVAHVQLCKAAGEAGDKLRLRSWIAIQLIGEDDAPIPNEKYAVMLPGGTIVSGTLDARGLARVDNIPSGVCSVSFPDLDKDAWTPVETESETTAEAAPAESAA